MISLKIDWFDRLAFPRDSQEPFSAPQFEGINSSALCLLYGPALTTVCDHWENHSLDYVGLCQQSMILYDLGQVLNFRGLPFFKIRGTGMD